MINSPHPFKGLSIRIPIIVPTKGRWFINQRPGESYEKVEVPNSPRVVISGLCVQVYVLSSTLILPGYPIRKPQVGDKN